MTYCSGASRQQGFVLAASVWMMAIAMLLAGVFHTWVGRQVDSAQAMIDHQDKALALANTRETLLYLLNTRRMTSAGLTQSLGDQTIPRDRDGNPLLQPVGGELRLDGTAYRGFNGTSFSLQDQAGLAALNSKSFPDTVKNWLRDSQGATRSKRLGATLADYIDENTRRRIDGAELTDYRQKGLTPPTNFYLRSPAELSAVLEWRDLLETQNGSRWYDWGAITRANVLNVNTMPKPLLMLSLDLDAAEAQNLIEARRRYPLRSLDGVARELGIPNTWNDEQFRFFPSERVRIRFWAEGWESATVESVQLTAQGDFGPFLIDYRFREGSRGQDGADQRSEQSVSDTAGRYFEEEFFTDS